MFGWGGRGRRWRGGRKGGWGGGRGGAGWGGGWGAGWGPGWGPGPWGPIIGYPAVEYAARRGYRYIGPCRSGVGPMAFYMDPSGRIVHAWEILGGPWTTWRYPYQYYDPNEEREALLREKEELERELEELKRRLRELEGEGSGSL